MATNYDGDIKLGVRLEPTDIKKSAEKISKEISSVFDASKGKKTTASLNRMLTTMDKLTARSQKLRVQMEKMETSKVPTKEYQELDNQLAKYERRVRELTAQQELLSTKIKDTAKGSKENDNLDKQIKKIKEKIELQQKYMKAVEKDRADMQKAGTDVMKGSDADPIAFQTLKDNLNDVTNRQRVALSSLDEYLDRNKQEIDPTLFNSIKDALGKTDDKISDLANNSVSKSEMIKSTVFNNLSGGAQKLVGSLSKLKGLSKTQIIIAMTTKALSKLTHTIVKFGKVAIKNVFEKGKAKVKSFFKTLNHGANSSRKPLKHALRMFMQYGIGMRSLYMLVRKLRAGLREGLQNLEKFQDGSNETNRAIVDMQSSLLYLKNAWASAFAPILNVVLPILSRLMDAIAQLANTIGAFFAAFTGQGTFIKATKVQKGYTSAVKGSAKAMKDLSNNLAGFDDLDVLQQDKDNDGGGGGGAEIDPNKMFEEVTVGDGISSLVDKIKEAWEQADFTELGTLIGTKIRDALMGIDWTSIQEVCYKIGKSIATFLNGYFETPMLAEVTGHSIAQALNSALEIAYAFVTNLHWDSIGTFVGTAIYRSIVEFDWNKLGATIATGINGVVTFVKNLLLSINVTDSVKRMLGTINTFFDTFNWIELGNTIALGINKITTFITTTLENLDIRGKVHDIMTTVNTALTEVDWEKVGASLSDMALTLLDMAIGAVAELDWVQLGKSIFDILEGVDWSTLISKLLTLVLDLAVGLFKMLWGVLIAGPVERLVGKVTGYMERTGCNVVEGLFLGITEVMADIVNFVYHTIFEPFINAFKDAFGIHSPSTVMAEQGDFLMQGLFNGISDMISSVTDLFGDLKEGILEKTAELHENVVEKYDTIKTSVVESVGSLKEKAVGKFKKLKSDVSTSTESLKKTTSEKYTKMKSSVSSTVDSLKSSLKKRFTDIKDNTEQSSDGMSSKTLSQYKAMQTNLQKVVSDLFKNVTDRFDKLKTTAITTFKNMRDTVVSIFNGLSRGIKNPINAMISGVEKMANGVVNAVNSMVNALNALSFSIPDWVPGLGGKSFGLNLPSVPNVSIPRLAQGAVIPPNREFLAMLGDQTHGTNIEAPLDTIVQAFESVVGNMQVENTGYSEMTLDGQTFARLITPYVMSELDRQGFNVEVLEV